MFEDRPRSRARKWYGWVHIQGLSTSRPVPTQESGTLGASLEEVLGAAGSQPALRISPSAHMFGFSGAGSPKGRVRLWGF